MFTGIVESTGTLNSLEPRGRGFHISIETKVEFDLLARVKLGDSIACNGVCLTATALNGTTFEADVSAETVKCTAFKNYRRGRLLNLELACTPSTHLGGHIVQGHVDQTATCVDIKDAEGSWYFTFRYAFDKEMAKRGYITVDKGSVTVNGVSLTVCNPTDDTFQVAIIPYTYEHTNFHTFAIGSVVNIEFDIIGKYISRMIQYK